MIDETPPCQIGDRIRLTDMPDDPHPIPAGAEGVVYRVQKLWTPGEWQIGVQWDDPRSLFLILPKDSFEIIQPAQREGADA